MKKSHGEIAVIGLSGRFPGANNINQFWRNICEGKESIERLTDDELRKAGVSEADINSPSYVKAAPVLQDFDKFDPAFFKVSPLEAELMDPQLRLLLQCAWEVLEDAGYATEAPQNIGVFSGSGGVTTSYLANFINLNKRFEKLTAGPAHLANDKDFLSTYISYKLNLTGPSVTIQTACSTSLVALHLACSSLLNNECDMAMAGGVSVRIPHIEGYHYKEGHIFSKSGHIRTFDAAADGVVFGSGLGLVLIKRYEDAVRDNDHIYAVIKGSAISNDGKGKMSYAASSAKGQVTCITEALRRAQISADKILFVESHGTGTSMGDPEEVKALSLAFKTAGDNKNYCALGALKANIGHLEAAAGIAGFIKAVLIVKHGLIPPLVNFSRPNPRIKFEKTPFYVNDTLKPLPQNEGGKSREISCVGVNSLGVGGTNAFVVLAQYMPQKNATRHALHSVIVPLSAKSRESLRDSISQLSDFITSASLASGVGGSSPDLVNLAYTLQIGRAPMGERVAFVVASLADLQVSLQQALDSKDIFEEKDISNRSNILLDSIFTPRARDKSSAHAFPADAADLHHILEKPINPEQLSILAQLWVDQGDVDWHKLYQDDFRPQRISLPTYVFAKQRYWIETGSVQPSTGRLHPLLHSNTSNLDEQSYRASFTGEEFFLKDHQIRLAEKHTRHLSGFAEPDVRPTNIHKVLPGVAYLEMAQAAIKQALPVYGEGEFLELCDVVWIQPFAVDGPCDINVALISDDSHHEAITFEIYSNQATDELIHCQGKVVLREPANANRVDIAQLRSRMVDANASAHTIYPMFAAMGLHYGPAYQGIVTAHYGEQQLLAQLTLPDVSDVDQTCFTLPPGLMDSAFQSSVLLLLHIGQLGDQPLLPFALESAKIISPCSKEMYVWARLSAGCKVTDRVITIDMDLCDTEGNVCVQVSGLSSRAPGKKSDGVKEKHYAQEDTRERLLATPYWQSRPLLASASKDIHKVHPVYAERHVILFSLGAVDFARLEAGLATDSSVVQCQHVVPAGDTIASCYQYAVLTCFEKIKSIFVNRPKGKVLVQWVVTNDAENRFYTGIAGLLRSAALENPQLCCQVILTEADITTDALTQILLAEQNYFQDFIVKYERQERCVQSCKIIDSDQDNSWKQNNNSEHFPFKNDGVYLITGGLGGLGIKFAREIIRHTSHARIILTGRRSAPNNIINDKTQSSQLQNLQDLQAESHNVQYRQLDPADPEQVQQLVEAIQDEYGQLNGIIHSAGMISDNFILKKERDELNRVLAPKVQGTFNLDAATQDMDLDFLVLFSSLTSVIGNLAQTDYAAANGFMDLFSTYRNDLVKAGRRKGLTLAINWPLWEEGGMGLDEASKVNLYKTVGIRPMASATGLYAFYRSLELRLDQAVVVEGELNRVANHLFNQPPAITALPSASSVDVLIAADSVSKPEQLELTQNFLRKQFSLLLKLPFQQINTEALLEDYGIDSILALDLTSLLEKSFGPLPKTLFFEYLTVRELAEYFVNSHSTLLAKLLMLPINTPQISNAHTAPTISHVVAHGVASKRIGRKTYEKLDKQRAESSTSSEREPVAIVGLSGRYPESRDIDAFWLNLREGKDCIIEVPEDRWNWEDYYSDNRSKPGHHYSKWGGFIEGVDEFDARFFNISPLEAETIDPQERLFLQHVWMAIEDAGYTRAGLQKVHAQAPHDKELPGQVGVYAGVMYNEYQLFGVEQSVRGQRVGFASNLASIANRVSYVLNLHGPSMALDTMCSSSLTAIHLACQDLHLGRVGLGIAGGVNITIHPNKYLMLSAGQFISGEGHCQSFGEGGDGYIPGEGVGVVILKRLSDAERDGNTIYGIIKGSALSHGGKTNGYTVPNPQAQASAVNQALTDAGINPRYISYIEAHGTGTKLGDPIEIAALSNVFRRATTDTGFCLIGSAKSNIGHCEAAAGIAGLTKVLLQMKYQKIVPSLHSERLNPHIDFETTPFVVNQSLKTWEQPVVSGMRIPRIAGVSSFGAGGSNAHIIVQEYPQATVSNRQLQSNQLSEFVVPLSARTAEQLQQKAKDLLDFLQRQTEPVDLLSMAYTLQIGREAMFERLGFIVSSVEQLIDNLRAYTKDNESVSGQYQGSVKTHKDVLASLTEDIDFQQTLDKWYLDKKISKLLELWVKGLEVDWQRLYPSNYKSHFMSLPGYPFAKVRFWVKEINFSSVSTHSHTDAILHPLLHKNISDLQQQGYSTRFSGREAFLIHSEGRKYLPVAAFFEMARVAIELARPMTSEADILELRHIQWLAPVDIAHMDTINTALFDRGRDGIHFEIYSRDELQDVVHCQGQAVTTHYPAPPRVDPAQLRAGMKSEKVSSALSEKIGLKHPDSIYRNEAQLLAELSLPERLKHTHEHYVLHPVIIDRALQLANVWLERFDAVLSQQTPVSLDTLRIIFACPTEVLVWIRFPVAPSMGNDSNSVDIDLIDDQGNVCVQIRGLGYRSTKRKVIPAADAVSSVAIQNIPLPVNLDGAIQKPEIPAIKRIPLQRNPAKAITSFSVGAPSASPPPISLETPAERVLFDVQQVEVKPQTIALVAIPLDEAPSDIVDESPVLVNLYDQGKGLFKLELEANTVCGELTDELIDQILCALDSAKGVAGIKALMITSDAKIFLKGGRDCVNAAIEQGLYQTIAAFPYPTIAVALGSATGAGFLLASLCDFMICNQDQNYSFTEFSSDSAAETLYPSLEEDRLLRERFGNHLAKHFMYLAPAIRGADLRTYGLSCPILATSALNDYAQRLALEFTRMSEDSLHLLKQHLSRKICNVVGSLTPLKVGINIEANSAHESVELLSPVKYIRVSANKSGVASIELRRTNKRIEPAKLLSNLTGIFNQINESQHIKSVVVVSEYSDFLPCSIEEFSIKRALELQIILLGVSVPIVVALREDASGMAWLISQTCDASVYCDTGSYSANGISATPAIAESAMALLAQQLGEQLAKQVLATEEPFSGTQLQAINGALVVVCQEQVVPSAIAMAERLAQVSHDNLVTWRKNISTLLKQTMSTLNNALDKTLEERAAPNADTLPYLALDSSVIRATLDADGVVVVNMEDRDARNMFSDAFTQGMVEVFAKIENNANCKVVVLTGYDNYFALGGNKETLLAIQQGRAKFTDNRVFELALTCKLPVVAAMQGHGFGAGWALGMFADFIFMSDESKYISPYMNYGFTPGAGSTLIFKEKIGYDLARETLLTAREYSGRELRDKGIWLPVVARKDVLPSALSLAKHIAQRSRDYLLSLKTLWTRNLYEPLEETYRHELEMHAQTFVGRSDTLQRILQSFSSEKGQGQRPVGTIVEKETSIAQSELTVAAIGSKLKALLANELRMDEEDIDPDTQFIDLGLDSITGVTWIRKVNEHYGTDIEAIKVYSYPTLAELTRYVKDEAEKWASATTTTRPVQNGPAEILPGPLSSPETSHVITAVSALLRKLLADELRMDEQEIDEHTQFIDLGLDSITGVTWIRKVNEHYGTDIEAIKVYSYPTLAELSRYVKDNIEKASTTSTVSTPTLKIPADPVADRNETSYALSPDHHMQEVPNQTLISWRKTSGFGRLSTTPSIIDEPIAVIGMAGQFPKAKNVEEFWENIARGRDCISEVPDGRWNINHYYQRGATAPGKTNSKWMGAIEEYDLFDPLFFNISPKEAKSMDPQQRLFLQACWHGIEDAGYNPKELSGSRCGVFAGCSGGDYHQFSRTDQFTALNFTGSETSILAARISYFLNLTGPCLSIDTACSSSLVAIAVACDSLCSAQSDIALAGGVNVMAGPEMHIKSAQAGMLSPDGKCHTFDQRANGFVPGESVGVVLLKRLSDAQRDGDTIYSVIQGWGINQDGKTNGITAPNADSQTTLQQGVFDRFRIDPATIQLIEAHGTGTALGDPIEISGLKTAFKKYTAQQDYCALGSVKSNIGHCLTAAGISGFIKLLLAIKHRQLPPTIHFTQLNSHIALKGSPFYVNDQLREWNVSSGQPRQAAISSFGFSGTNAFLVMAESAQLTGNNIFRSEGTSDVVIPLSARTQEQLRQKARDLYDFVQREKLSLDLEAVAYTLQVGREPMSERLGFIVNSVEQLEQKLESCILGDQKSTADIYQSQSSGKQDAMLSLSQDADFQETLDKWISNRKLAKLIEFWVRGLDLDWKRLHKSSASIPKRIHLPGYPFAKERYWIEGDNVDALIRRDGMPLLHPLVHRNTSTLSQQSYTSNFTSDEFFVTCIQPSSTPNETQILSPLTYPEMARAALEQAMPSTGDAGIWELFDLSWGPAFLADPRTPLTIALFADSSDAIGFEIFSVSPEGGQETLHCLGSAAYRSATDNARHDLSLLKEQLQNRLDPATIGTSLERTGISFDSFDKTITAIYQGPDQLLVQLESTNPLDSNLVMHPALMAGALQAAIAIPGVSTMSTPPIVPANSRRLRIISAFTPHMYALIRWNLSVDHPRQMLLDIDFCDSQGTVCMEWSGLLLQSESIYPTMHAESSGEQTSITGSSEAAAKPATIQLGDLQDTFVFEQASTKSIALSTAAIAEVMPKVPTGSSAGTFAQGVPEKIISLDQLQRELTASLADALYLKESDIHPTKPFIELGLDSIVGVEWIGVINKKYATTIAATRVYDYPDVKELAIYLREEIACVLANAQNEANSLLHEIANDAIASRDSSVQLSEEATTVNSQVLSAARPKVASIETLQHQLQESLADALYLKISDIQLTKPFVELGLDSIVGVEWIGVINKQYGTDITATSVYDYPNIKEFAGYLYQEISGAIPATKNITVSADMLATISQAHALREPELPVFKLPATSLQAAPHINGRTRSRARFLNQNAIRFQPKYDESFRQLYFYSPYCSGNIEQGEDFCIRYTLNLEENICLKEHVVFGEHLFPTDAYLELVYSACRVYFSEENLSFKSISIVNPLLGFALRDIYLKLTFRRHQDGLQFFISSGSDAEFGSEKIHMQGLIATSSINPPSYFTQVADVAYETELSGSAIPTNAGKFYAPLQKLSFSPSLATGIIRVAPHDFSFLLNPFVAYGGLCTVINYAVDQVGKCYGVTSDQFLPYKLHDLWVSHSVVGTEFTSYAKIKKLEPDSVDFYLEILDQKREPVMIIETITLRRVSERTIKQQVSSLKEALLLASPSALTSQSRNDYRPTAPEGVAIIGMSCRYPMSANVEEFWENLQQGRDCITEVPAERWQGFTHWYDPDPRSINTSYSRWGGFLDDISCFDPLFFGIAPSEAEIIDPQQRIFLEESWKAIESAGYAPSSLSNQSCGVYVGCAAGDYTRILSRAGKDTVGAAFMGSSTAILAARISYHLNLKGPSIAIDTACSSSLTAVHLACESIRQQENQMALAGGINLLATPLGHILTSQVGMPSKDGKCFAFDASANGIVFSEGCGVILLKSLSHAVQDGDNILGVIKGSGINQDGKTNGITAPSARAQEKLLNQIYERFSINPEKISYIEAHGTGTALGDPIEVNALTAVFQKYSSKKSYCALGSVKSNIGHTGFAAGVAGIIKVLLSLKYKTLLPSINFTNPNPHIAFDHSPFYVNTRRQEWESHESRMASVSSFGFSGTNAHIVIEEYTCTDGRKEDMVTSPNVDFLVPLSAKSHEQLQQKARDLLVFIERHADSVGLNDMAYTLQSGRDAMNVRLGLVVSSMEQLTERLSAYLKGDTKNSGIHCGELKHNTDVVSLFTTDADMQKIVAQWFADKQLHKLLDLWVKGLDLDWGQLHDSNLPRRIMLPGYPFAKERCWIDAPVSHRADAVASSNTLHPLLHSNTSSFNVQSYASIFTGDEFFFNDHRVKLNRVTDQEGERVLPGVAYLEMARAAVRQALPATDNLPLELRNIIWAAPITFEPGKRVTTVLLPNHEQQVDFEIRSYGSAHSDPEDGVIHCQGQVVLADPIAQTQLDIDALKQQALPENLTAEVIYAAFASIGVDYGPGHRAIHEIAMGENQLLATLNLPTSVAASFAEFALHPSILDGALQSTIALSMAHTRSPKASLPFALDSILIMSHCTPRMYAWVRYAENSSAEGRVIRYDLDLCNAEGVVCVQIKGFSTRHLDHPQGLVNANNPFDENFYEDVIERVMKNDLSIEEAAALG